MNTATKTLHKVEAPIIKMTEHDKVSSGLYAVVMLLGTGVGLLIMVWLANLLPVYKLPPAVQLLEENPGGAEDGLIDGVPNEKFAIGSSDADASDPITEAEAAPAETRERAAESLDPAVMAEVPDQPFPPPPNSGPPSGSPWGEDGRMGRPPIGIGQRPGRGFPREVRWLVKFVERGTTEEYAAQLDFFGIELGALMPDGKLQLISKLTAERPMVRTLNSGQAERRLYFTWKGGARKQLDLQLFQKTGIKADDALLMHFYPPETENLLAIIERNYRQKKSEEIRHTYFVVRAAKQGYEFTVTSQTYVSATVQQPSGPPPGSPRF